MCRRGTHRGEPETKNDSMVFFSQWIHELAARFVGADGIDHLSADRLFARIEKIPQ